MSELYERSQWLNKSFDFRFGDRIVEYDMKSAGLSIIKQYKLLPESKIQELDAIPDKHTLNVKIGLLCRDDKEFNSVFQDSFKEARKLFIDANGITEDYLVSIKRDALFVIGKKCDNLNFGNITFVEKNIYTSYMKLNRLEFYINTKIKNVDIKGLGQGNVLESIKERQKDCMLKFISDFVRMKELNIDANTINMFLMRFVKRYRERTIDPIHYAEINQVNAIRLFDDTLNDWIYVDAVDEDRLQDIDITYNYFNYIVPIVSLTI